MSMNVLEDSATLLHRSLSKFSYLIDGRILEIRTACCIDIDCYMTLCRLLLISI